MGGNVTFVYQVSDCVGNATATVTLTFPPVGGLAPLAYNYTIPMDDPFNTGDDLCSDVVSPNGGAVTVVGPASTPLAAAGVVTLGANCSWSFDPKDGWFGERLGGICWLHTQLCHDRATTHALATAWPNPIAVCVAADLTVQTTLLW